MLEKDPQGPGAPMGKEELFTNGKIQFPFYRPIHHT